jgi:hypothetical protein
VALPTSAPIVPVRVREPFDHPDWIFEPKLDVFRALAYVEDGVCRSSPDADTFQVPLGINTRIGRECVQPSHGAEACDTAAT